MPKITYIDNQENSKTIDVENGLTVMEGAIQNNIPGIDADCGGNCACGTCQVFVNSEWISKVGEKSEMENSMLEFSENVKLNSRLSCQIEISEEHEGLTVELPKAQY